MGHSFSSSMLVYSGPADKAQQAESYQQHAVYGGEKGKMLKPAARSPWGQLRCAWGLRDTVAAGRAPEQGGTAPASPALAWFEPPKSQRRGSRQAAARTQTSGHADKSSECSYRVWSVRAYVAARTLR